MQNLKIRASAKIVSLALVTVGLMSTLGMSSASAATAVPGHSQSLACNFGDPGRLDWTAWIKGFYGNEWLRVYPVLWMKAPGGTWHTMASGMTDRWYNEYASWANRYYGSSFYVNVQPGYYYTIQTYFYWPKLGYGVWENSNTCFVGGGINVV
jgi:hypothetical protein